MKCCVSTDVGTWTNRLTFEPDPDYSPDIGTGLLSPLSYKRWYAEFSVGKIDVIYVAVFTYRSPHFGFHWGRPWGNHAKCCMDGKSIQCLQIVLLHVPI